MHSKTRAYLLSIGASERALPETPEELMPFACYVPDSGYCIVAIPECFAEKSKGKPESYEVPIPAKYVIEKGYRLEGDILYCDVQYDSTLGVIVPDKYEAYANSISRPSKPTMFAKGEKSTLMVGRAEGMIFEVDIGGALLLAGFNSPSPKEIAQFEAGQSLKAAMFYREGVLFMLFEFGSLSWVDAPYTPHLSRVNPLHHFTAYQRLPLMCLLADVPSGIVKSSIRNTSLPTHFTRQFLELCRDMTARPFDRATYDDTVNRLMARYSTYDMAQGAIAKCSVSEE